MQYTSPSYSVGEFFDIFTVSDYSIAFTTNAQASTGGSAVIRFNVGGFSTSNTVCSYHTAGITVGNSTNTPTARLDVRSAGNTSGSDIANFERLDGTDVLRIGANGKSTYLATNTPAGTTGAQTIDRPSGTINIAAGESSKLVNNSLCTTASIVLPVIRTNDATATIKNVVPGAGSFTINLGAAATAETSVGFFIIN
jgi:hypothetical protein